MTYGEMRTILRAVTAREDGRFTVKRAWGHDFGLNLRDNAGLEWMVELIDWTRRFRAPATDRMLFRLAVYDDFARFFPEFPEIHPDLYPGQGARLGWRSNDPGPYTACMTWPQVLRVVGLVEQVYPRWELRAIEGTTDVDGVRHGTYDNGTYERAADRYLITVACPMAAATAGVCEDTLPVGCYRDT